ncbi:unnamed protein product [Closterium sp. Naga37s-1]|nr:unnamed protein product [Closterium sp. Naga37s-1]
MDLVRKFKRRLRSIGGASGITATAGAGGSSAECAGDWPSGVISKSFSVECGAPHAGPNPLLGATNSHARPIPKNHSINTSDSRLQGKELQLDASGVTISEEEDRRQRSSRPPRRTQRAVSQHERDAGAGKSGQRCRADECAGGAGESGADHSRGSRSDVEDCGSDEIKGDDLQRRHTWQVQTQRHASDIAAAAALPESAKAFANNRHSSSNRNEEFSYEFAQSASFAALGSLPGTGAAGLPPRLTEAQLLLIQAAQHASSSGMAIDWARQQQQQHRKVTDWLGTLSDQLEVDALTETPFASAELPHEASASIANHETAAALLAAGRVPRVAACVSPSDSDGRAASLNPPADGDMVVTVNRQLKLECAGSPSGTPSPGVPSPRGVIMRGSGGTGSSGDGEEAENDRQRKASGRRDCEATKAEATDDWVPGCERTARRDCKGSCSDGDGSECGGDLEGGSRGGKWSADDAATACVSKHPGASDNALLTSVRVAFNQLVATRQSEQVRGARALRDLARESDAVRSSIVAVGAIPALVSIVNLAASAPHAAATGDTTVASLILDGDGGAAATETGAPLVGTRLGSASCEEGGIEAAAQGGRERALTSPLVDYSISCLVNLSITRDMKATICQAGAVPPLIRLMCSARAPSCAPACACCAPTSASTRANAAVALLSLSKLSDATRLHMAYSGGVEALVHFLSDTPSDAPDCPAAAAGAPATGGLQGSGSSKSCKGRREAAAALQSLASVPAVRPRLVHAGAVPLLLELVGHAAASHLTCSSRFRGAERRTERTSRTEDDAVATAERALAVLALLAESEEGRAEVQRRGGMEMLVGVVRAGGPSGTCVERAISGLTAMVGGSLNCRWEVARIGVEGAVKEVAIHGSGKAKVKHVSVVGGRLTSDFPSLPSPNTLRPFRPAPRSCPSPPSRPSLTSLPLVIRPSLDPSRTPSVARTNPPPKQGNRLASADDLGPVAHTLPFRTLSLAAHALPSLNASCRSHTLFPRSLIPSLAHLVARSTPRLSSHHGFSSPAWTASFHFRMQSHQWLCHLFVVALLRVFRLLSSFPCQHLSSFPSQPLSSFPSQSLSCFPSQPLSSLPSQPLSSFPSQPLSSFPSQPHSSFPCQPHSSFPSQPLSSFPSQPLSSFPSQSLSSFPSQHLSSFPSQPLSSFPSQSLSCFPSQPLSSFPSQLLSSFPSQPLSSFPSQSFSSFPSQSLSSFSSQPLSSFPSQPHSSFPCQPHSSFPSQPLSSFPSQPHSSFPSQPLSYFPSQPLSSFPSQSLSSFPSQPLSSLPSQPLSSFPSQPLSSLPSQPLSSFPSQPLSSFPSQPLISFPSQNGAGCHGEPCRPRPARRLTETRPAGHHICQLAATLTRELAPGSFTRFSPCPSLTLPLPCPPFFPLSLPHFPLVLPSVSPHVSPTLFPLVFPSASPSPVHPSALVALVAIVSLVALIILIMLFYPPSLCGVPPSLNLLSPFTPPSLSLFSYAQLPPFHARSHSPS